MKPKWQGDAGQGVSGPMEGGKYAEKDVIRYPGELRNTLIVRDENLLVEVQFAAETGTHGTLLSKHDG